MRTLRCPFLLQLCRPLNNHKPRRFPRLRATNKLRYLLGAYRLWQQSLLFLAHPFRLVTRSCPVRSVLSIEISMEIF